MKGRRSQRSRELIAAGAIVLGLATAGFLSHPPPAYAASHELHLLGDRTLSVPVVLVDGAHRKIVVSDAPDVGALLEQQGIHLGRYDEVSRPFLEPLVANETIRVSRVARWTSTQRLRVQPETIRRLDFALPPGEMKVIERGAAGERLALISFTSRDGRLKKYVVASHLLRLPRARVIAEGVGTYAAFADFARRGLEKTAYIAANAIDMVATAYTADCYGCSGYTAIGYRAGRGIVAVDPRVIPLGTKLFIPGYGFAIAGDTGGAIVGYRIDLGFDSVSDAISFGRRPVRVYTLR